MKKLTLVLTLVLGLSVVANAAIVVDYTNTTQGTNALESIADIGDVISITIGIDAPAAGGTTDFRVFVDSAIDANGALLGEWWLTPAIEVTDADPQVVWFKSGTAAGLPAPAGDYLQIDFVVAQSAMETGELAVAYTGDFFGSLPDAQSLQVIPEPMTIALLGLGGLFIRRRLA